MSQGRTSRREFFQHAGAGLGAAAVGGGIWAWLLQQQARATPFALRPPGALPEADFLGRCIRCGQCVVDCPFDTLKLAALGEPYPIGTPHFVARDVPCYMCPDIPCVKACPTGALDPGLTDITEADMGLAVLVDQENCLSYRGLRCEICHRQCPLTGDAITVENHPRKLSRHAVFVPVVHSEHCTGCGVCENVCPLPAATIRVLPRKLAQGRLGDHYRLGWTEDTPITQDFREGGGQAADEEGIQQGLDYLNQGDL